MTLSPTKPTTTSPATLATLLAPPPDHVEVVDVPSIRFLMIDGRGDPNTSPAYAEAIQALYSASYGLRFGIKHAEGLTYKVGPLEGLFWTDEMAEFRSDRKDEWSWTMMIAQPDAVTPAWVERIVEDGGRRKNVPAVTELRLVDFREGLSAQVMHVGPYAAEAPTIARLHEAIRRRHGRFDGRIQKHHEIYLTDPRRLAPERLRTLVRQPFEPAIEP